jgi:hypothetical protein
MMSTIANPTVTNLGCGSRSEKDGSPKIIYYFQGIQKIGGLYRKKFIYLCEYCMDSANQMKSIMHASKCRFRKIQVEEVVSKSEYKTWRKQEQETAANALKQALTGKG